MLVALFVALWQLAAGIFVFSDFVLFVILLLCLMDPV